MNRLIYALAVATLLVTSNARAQFSNVPLDSNDTNGQQTAAGAPQIMPVPSSQPQPSASSAAPQYRPSAPIDAYQAYLDTGQIVPPQRPQPLQPPQPTFDQLSNNLATYRGRPLDDAINNFGYPDTQQVIAGHNLYIWAVNLTQGFSNPDGGGSINLTAHCKVTMEANEQKIVTRIVYEGNMPGCSKFMEPAATSTPQVVNAKPA